VPSWFDELAAFLRIPSVSADPARGVDVRRAGEWVCELIRGAGGEAEIVEVDTPSGAQASQPLAVGEIRASQNPGDAPTVLCYGHFDVQPPDPLELWESPPFEPEIRGEYLYGRGVADDKGQLYVMLSAARELARAGTLAVNVRFVCDGEEETGGQSVLAFIADDPRGADAAVIFDSGMVARDVPAFDIATRGMAYFHLTLRTGVRDLHSGIYGGAALNAVQALCETLAALAPSRDGCLPEPLRAGIREPTAAELESWARLPAGADELSLAGVAPRDADAARDYHLRTFAEPALDVNGLLGGSPILEKTVLPVEAQANVSMRLAPGQDVDTIVAAFRELIAAAVPTGATLEVELKSSARPGIIDPDARAVALGQDAFQRALGVRPLLVRSGGTLPIVAALADLGIPTIITGFSLPDANIHSPNERLLVEYVERGIAAARELFTAFAAL
jgi:acetylornithine deacetylase/succinyl-diaminopimelate desuccinylase-like protein